MSRLVIHRSRRMRALLRGSVWLFLLQLEHGCSDEAATPSGAEPAASAGASSSGAGEGGFESPTESKPGSIGGNGAGFGGVAEAAGGGAAGQAADSVGGEPSDNESIGGEPSRGASDRAGGGVGGADSASAAGDNSGGGTTSVSGVGGNGGNSGNGGNAGNGAAGGHSGNGGEAGARPVSALPCDVRAALKARCWSCHGDPPKAPAPMSLTTWSAVHQYADALQEKLDAELMPPPGAPGLSATQLDTLLVYASTGAPSAGAVSCR
jgi:hypothetical protein